MVGLSAASVSRHLSLLTLSQSIRELVDAGFVGISSAAELARLDDVQLQDELAQRIAHGELNREQVTAEVQAVVGRKATANGKSQSVRLQLPSGVGVTLKGDCPLDLETCIEVLKNVLSFCRKEARKGRDLTTVTKLLPLQTAQEV